MNDINAFGTNTDEPLNPDYFMYCYKGGTWVDPDLAINEEQARIKLAALVPTLKTLYALLSEDHAWL